MDDNQTSRSRDALHTFEPFGLAGAIAVVVAALSGCEHATLVEQSVQGPSPQLAKPAHALIPTVNVARREGGL